MKFLKGWLPDTPDHRDFLFAPRPEIAASLPPMVDWSTDPCQPPILSQGELGSCTSFAIASAVQFERRQANEAPDFIPSHLFIYYNERAMEGSIGYDSGAMIRDGIKSVAQQGVCPETNWPYDITKFKRKPTTVCYKTATKYTAIQYARVARTLNDFKTVLASKSLIVAGISVYDSFMSNEVATTGVVPLPSKTEKLQGGHAIDLIGYSDQTERFIVRNSWGTEWGNKGFFTIPYQYILDSNLSDDFWVITTIKS